MQQLTSACALQPGPPPRRMWTRRTARALSGTPTGAWLRRAGRLTSTATPPASGQRPLKRHPKLPQSCQCRWQTIGEEGWTPDVHSKQHQLLDNLLSTLSQ